MRGNSSWSSGSLASLDAWVPHGPTDVPSVVSVLNGDN